jgi:CheY-like chemotaxis protein
MTDSIFSFGLSRSGPSSALRLDGLWRWCYAASMSSTWGGQERGASHHILLVEDNADARDAMRALLELDGHTVEVAAEGVQALDLARSKRPDVALVDIGLPGLDGYEVARRLRTLDPARPILIALTGYSQPEDRERATEAGFDAHLVKPVDPDELTRLLATLETPRRGSRG